jgi:hypothetical protein
MDFTLYIIINIYFLKKIEHLIVETEGVVLTFEVSSGPVFKPSQTKEKRGEKKGKTTSARSKIFPGAAAKATSPPRLISHSHT